MTLNLRLSIVLTRRSIKKGSGIQPKTLQRNFTSLSALARSFFRVIFFYFRQHNRDSSKHRTQNQTNEG